MLNFAKNHHVMSYDGISTTRGRIISFLPPVKKIGPGNSGFLSKRDWQRAEWPHHDGAVNPGWQGSGYWIHRPIFGVVSWRSPGNIFPAKASWNAIFLPLNVTFVCEDAIVMLFYCNMWIMFFFCFCYFRLVIGHMSKLVFASLNVFGTTFQKLFHHFIQLVGGFRMI